VDIPAVSMNECVWDETSGDQEDFVLGGTNSDEEELELGGDQQ